jgi:uncharacterized protein
MTTLVGWDEEKADLNLQKHGVSFDEAQTVFADPLAITISDPEHSRDEDRFITIGQSNKRLILLVVYTDRRKRIRLISARKASRAERKQYEEEDSS